MNRTGNAPLRVAVYCRTAHESEELDAQVQAYTALVNDHAGWELAAVYQDQAPSGRRMRRQKALARLLADCRKGKIDKVLVKSISRLARNMQDCQEILRELTALGVSVRFETEQIDTGEDNLWAKCMDIYLILARQEAENLKRHRGCGCCTGWPTIRGRRFL